MTTKRGTKNYLLNLQVLRLVAASLVVLGHIVYSADRMAISAGSLDLAERLLLRFGVGVDIFFIISGFIMFYLCHDKFGQSGESRDFFIRRVIRIVPTYWAFTGLMIASIAVFADQVTTAVVDPWHFIASMSFIPWPNPDGLMRPVLKLGWTLNYEMFFYVAFGLALACRRSLGLPALFAVFVAAVVLNIFVPSEPFVLKFWSDPVILEFLFGIGLAAAFLHGWRVSIAQACALAATGCVLLFFLVPLPEFQHPAFRPLISGLPSLMIAAAFALAPHWSGLDGLNRVVVLCGNASYCLYLSHPFTLNAVERVGHGVWLAHPLAFVATAFAASVLVSIILHLCLEQPMIQLLSRSASAASLPGRVPSEVYREASPAALEKS